jgi:ribosomal protein S18 acetylase RimI-like enzyme
MQSIVGRKFAHDPTDMPFCGLEWAIFGPHGFRPEEIVRLWQDSAGRTAGWVIIDSEDAFLYRVKPGLQGSALEREIVEWAEQSILSWRAEHGLNRRCAIFCWTGDDERVAIVTKRGYKPSEAAGVLLSRSLDGDLPSPRPPAGWAVRGVTEADVDSRAQAQFEAFSPGSHTTPEKWRYLMKNAPGYDPDLDNIAVREDGTVGAGALVWLDHDNRIGEFEPVGTRPQFQRMGLGRAILLRGLARMRERGMRTAIVGTNATNAAAIATYESVGFRICARSVEYVLEP